MNFACSRDAVHHDIKCSQDADNKDLKNYLHSVILNYTAWLSLSEARLFKHMVGRHTNFARGVLEEDIANKIGNISLV